MGISAKRSNACAPQQLYSSSCDESEMVIAPAVVACAAADRRRSNCRNKEMEIVQELQQRQPQIKLVNAAKMSEEREEGEIVDEYEDIISSDEEFSMRKRIEELEARNAELEKIANISGNCNSFGYTKNDRYVDIELSDIDDTSAQFVAAAKSSSKHSRHRHIRKSGEQHSYRRSSHSADRDPIRNSKLKTKRRRSKYSSTRSRNTKANSPLKRFSILEPVSSSEDDLEVFPLNRDKLRRAINRNDEQEAKGNLRERLDKKNEKQKNIPTESSRANIANDDDDDSDSASLEEQELRLIALKSAVMKKHLERKKRNEALKNAYSPSDFDEILATIHPTLSPKATELVLEPCNSMEISPVASPQIIISDDEHMIEPSCTKPIDMDIADSESDDNSPILVGINNQWIPIEQIPLPKNLNNDLNKPKPIRSIDLTKELSDDGKLVTETDEEDEEALRLLLLSKMKPTKPADEIVEPSKTTDEPAEIDSANEAENLRQMLLENMKSSAPTTTTEMVLKEAVRRLTARTGGNAKRARSCDTIENTEKELNVSTNEYLSEDESRQNSSRNSCQLTEKKLDYNEKENVPSCVDVPLKTSDEPIPTHAPTKEITNEFEKSTEQSCQNIQKPNLLPSKLPSEIPNTTLVQTTTNLIAKDTSTIDSSNKVQIKPLSVAAATKPLPAKTLQLKQPPPHITTKSINTILKRKSIEQMPDIPAKKVKQSRLITKVDTPKVKQLIISLKATDSDSDSEGDSFSRTFANHFVTIDNDYYDNGSPKSLPMSSPFYSRSNSPLVLSAETMKTADNSVINKNGTKSLMNDVFQSKLDAFLRNVRSTVEQTKQDEPSANVEETMPATPVAVRHLPESSQLEYRRLIHRMNMLEKQKKVKNAGSAIDESPSNTAEDPKVQSTAKLKVTINNDGGDINSNQNQGRIIVVNEGASIESEVQELPKDSLKKTVLLKNAANAEAEEKRAKDKSELLTKYELAYARNGSILLQNTNQTLDLVLKAKGSKLKKLRMEKSLDVLRKQIVHLQSMLDVENKHIAQLYTKITNSHKNIVTLRTRRDKLDKATTTLGRTVNGDDFSLNNDLKVPISEKTKQLNLEIKHLREMNSTNISTEKSTNNISKNIGSLAPTTTTAAICDKALHAAMPDHTSTGKCDLVINDLKNESAIQSTSENDHPKGVENQSVEEQAKNREHPKDVEEQVTNIEENDKTELENPPIKEDNLEITRDNRGDVQNDIVIEMVTETGTTSTEEQIKSLSELAAAEDKVPEEIVATETEVTPEDQQPIEVPLEEDVKLSSILEEEDAVKPEGEHTHDDTGKRKTIEYVSPLGCKTEECKITDPNGVLCPYDLMGQCDDKNCKYTHLSSGTTEPETS